MGQKDFVPLISRLTAALRKFFNKLIKLILIFHYKIIKVVISELIQLLSIYMINFFNNQILY